ncbi:MAG: hypothetical protein F6K62_22405 [Sphaerospermopsis sp. SIO1G2]|nr:hypothetical protein [Sphaerospermopsis sp. SIO1G2]
MAANASKLVLHAAIMIWLLNKQLDGLRGHGVTAVALRATIAAIATGLVALGIYQALLLIVPSTTLIFRFILVAIPGLVGAAVYLFSTHLLGVEELKTIFQLIRRR